MTRAPLALRFVHALLFSALAALACGGAWPEWLQLWTTTVQPFHVGEPPRWLALVGSLLASLGVAAVLVQLARARAVPIAVSAAILVSLAMVGVAVLGHPPERRSLVAANLELLSLAARMHRAQVPVLQASGFVSADPNDWRRVLRAAVTVSSPYRRGLFAQQEWDVALVPERSFPHLSLPPGTVAVWVSPDRAAFEMTPIGIDPHSKQVGALVDDRRERVVLSGVVNPELQQPTEH